jgi:hypothetical protein
METDNVMCMQTEYALNEYDQQVQVREDTKRSLVDGGGMRKRSEWFSMSLSMREFMQNSWRPYSASIGLSKEPSKYLHSTT